MLRLVVGLFVCAVHCATATAEDHLRALQKSAFETRQADWGFWGTDETRYSNWKNHSNRMIPIYTFGISLDGFAGKQSVYRIAPGLKKLYGQVPERTLNDKADYLDQTDVWHLQMRAVDELNKRYVFLVVFDGMDWHTTRMASIAKLGKVAYKTGRGKGMWFQDYRGAQTDFGYMVTSPHNSGSRVNVDEQTIKNPGGTKRGGYCTRIAGVAPWSSSRNHEYMIGKSKALRHAVTDSAASATAMTSGIKAFNGSINVAYDGKQVEPIGRWLQTNRDFAIGVVTSVPISHATPSATYANNVERGDYQDLARDLVGRPSIAHPDPLSGVDVLIGCGWGVNKDSDSAQGENFVPGNRYLTDEDKEAVDERNGGAYVVAERIPGRLGTSVLERGVRKAIREKKRLLGFFGSRQGHLPFQTADGNYDSVQETYTLETRRENPRLAEMTYAAIRVLEKRSERFWLMVEAGDVDWACHSNNVDDAIGAVFSGDDAFRAITLWIERKNAWDDSAVIVTADHGHYFILTDPEALIPKKQ